MDRVLTDGGLVARCRAGDQAAWTELVTRFSRYVYAIATQAYRLGEQDAEDVFQEVFARVYRNLGSLRDDEAIRPWIAQVTRRLCLDRIRDSSHEEPLDELELPETRDRLGELDEAFGVHEALAALPENCREILDRFFARDESYRVIGEALGLPAGTVASRISRCLAKLREAFEGRKSEPDVSGHLMGKARIYDEEQLARLIGALPPAPASWVEAARALPFAGLDDIIGRAQADAEFRKAALADLEAALEQAGVVPAPPVVAELRRRLAQ